MSAQMALVSTFFQMFIVLGIYNFGRLVKGKEASSEDDHNFLGPLIAHDVS